MKERARPRVAAVVSLLLAVAGVAGASAGERARADSVAASFPASRVLAPALASSGASSVAASAGKPAAGTDDAGSFAPGWKQQGRISYYGRRFASKPTASGETFDPDAMTMAHPSLPFGSIVRVKNLQNGRSVELRVNDRGPYEKGRIADVSRAAARELRMLRRGVVRARIELLRVGDDARAEDEARD